MDIKWPVNISCEELLKEQCTYCGWLKKERKVKFLSWPRLYCVLSDRCFYYFKNDDSKNPSGKFPLYGYNKVIRNVDENVKWSFILEHVQPNQKNYIFSASSQQEMVEWMKYIKQEMLRANNRGQRTTADGSSDGSVGSCELQKIEEKIYDDINPYKPVYSTNSFSSDSDSDTDEAEIKKPERKYEEERRLSVDKLRIPALPISQKNSCSLKGKEPPARFQIPDMPKRSPAEGQSTSRRPYEHVERKPEKDYWESIYYDGDKDEAVKIIEDIAKDGVFLVRKSDNPHYPKVLVAYSQSQQKARMFRIFINEHNTMYYLRKEKMFETIEELIYHYYYNCISLNETFKLTVPYLLSNSK